MRIVDFRGADVREKIAGDPREERNIEGEELSHVDIVDCL
jgi:hypothetical protein